MRCSLWSADLGFGCSLRTFVTFLDVSVSRAMGCFFGCFRVRDFDADHRRNRRSRALTSTEAMISQNRLSAVFLSEGDNESQCKDEENPDLGSPHISKELKEEAKFLKACGTIVETPAEIRKASRKFKASPPNDVHSEDSELHSWLPNTSIKKLQLDQHPDEPPTPIQISGEWQKGTVSSEHTPSSCISNVQNTGGFSINSVESSGTGSSVCMEGKGNSNESDSVSTSVSPWLSPPKNQCRNKSVHFECESDKSSSRSSSGNVSQRSKNMNSPYPTPLKLSEEMQTPGTVFASNIKNVANGQTRIRSQYVYSVLNPVENVSQWKILKEEGSDSNELSGELIESFEHPETETPKSKFGLEQTEELMLDMSLSSWLKPVTSAQDANVENIKAVSHKNPHFGRTPGDRPIIGMVAAHWNKDDPSDISPKWWDGNGIPNSTNKYKEDQKVSWHATPFEERLEKALSEESAPPQRSFTSGNSIDFDENEESDTALSQLPSSTHAKSVVSF